MYCEIGRCCQYCGVAAKSVDARHGSASSPHPKRLFAQDLVLGNRWERCRRRERSDLPVVTPSTARIYCTGIVLGTSAVADLDLTRLYQVQVPGTWYASMTFPCQEHTLATLQLS